MHIIIVWRSIAAISSYTQYNTTIHDEDLLALQCQHNYVTCTYTENKLAHTPLTIALGDTAAEGDLCAGKRYCSEGARETATLTMVCREGVWR